MSSENSRNNIKELHIKFLLPFSVNLPNGVYGISNEKFYCTVNLRKKVTQENAAGMIGGMHIMDDRFGLTNHTTVLVRFVLSTEWNADKISHKQLKQFSLEAVNSILDQCRLNSDDYYNHDIVSKDVSGTEYKFFKSDGTVAEGSSLMLGGGGSMVLSTSGSSMKEEPLKIIQDNLKNKNPFFFIIELIKNAIDYFRFENYRMAAIEIETAIEITVSNIIVNYLTNLQQTDPTQMTAYLESSNLDNCTITDFPRSNWKKVKPVLRKATFDTITTEAEYDMWLKKCQLLRHRVVHAGYIPKECEAKESIEYGIKFFHVLQNYHDVLKNESISFAFSPQKSGEFILSEENVDQLQLEDFEDISQVDNNTIQSKILEARKKNEAKLVSETLDYYNEILNLDPLNIDVLIDKGNLLFNENKIPEARSCYEKVIETDPTEIIGFMGLGNTKIKQNDVLEGLKEYQDALQINPIHQQTMRNRGITLLQHNQLEDARCQFKFLLEKFQNDALSWYALAIIDAHAKKKDNVIKYLTQAIKYDKSFKEDIKKETIFKQYEQDKDFKKLTE